LSILNDILASEQKATETKNNALIKKQTLIDKSRQDAKQLEQEKLHQARLEISNISNTTSKKLKKLDEEFSVEIESLKKDLIDGLDEKVNKSVLFLLKEIGL
jgi:F0F1-type ATP synthase membrane subunit b/b'